jgi:uncharacterized membrane protein (UPF0127 family)
MVRVAVCILLIATACSQSSPASRPQSTTPSPTSSLQHSPALIETAQGSVLFNVELAVTDRERAAGLMNRDSLGATDGLALLFFHGTRVGLWMKNTSIPLSAAFFDDKGTILKILDMDPCRQSPCRVYRPGVTYVGALEVNQGAFKRDGVSVGDTVHLAP